MVCGKVSRSASFTVNDLALSEFILAMIKPRTSDFMSWATGTSTSSGRLLKMRAASLGFMVE